MLLDALEREDISKRSCNGFGDQICDIKIGKRFIFGVPGVIARFCSRQDACTQLGMRIYILRGMQDRQLHIDKRSGPVYAFLRLHIYWITTKVAK